MRCLWDVHEFTTRRGFGHRQSGCLALLAVFQFFPVSFFVVFLSGCFASFLTFFSHLTCRSRLLNSQYLAYPWGGGHSSVQRCCFAVLLRHLFFLSFLMFFNVFLRFFNVLSRTFQGCFAPRPAQGCPIWRTGWGRRPWKNIEKTLKKPGKTLNTLWKNIEKTLKNLETTLNKYWNHLETHWKTVKKHWKNLQTNSKQPWKNIEKSLENIEKHCKTLKNLEFS